MIRGRQPLKGPGLAGLGPAATGQLPYAVELWNLPRTEPERIIARAASATLARAIFAAAQNEHLGRRIVLRRGSQVLQQTE
ncbi:MAG: hypothetical protein JWQ97_843 [Phenylobacterium sp.]|nr:hypothetical protein [Phenylobacterium sp.]